MAAWKLTLTYTKVGGTAGIGAATAREFSRSTIQPTVYLVGRNEAQASKLIEEMQSLNPDGQTHFIKSDISLLRNVDKTCEKIQGREDRINLLFMSTGLASLKGRDGAVHQILHDSRP